MDLACFPRTVYKGSRDRHFSLVNALSGLALCWESPMLLKDFVSPVRRRRRSRLDRFGRVVDHRWINASNVDVDRFKYGYDRNSNRTYKENGVIASLSEVYTYDDLNQLASYKLGTLNGGKTDVTGTPTNAQSWDYDAVGNWDSVTTNSTTQTRGANRQNEITSVSGATTPTYDNNGNLTKDENGYRFVYDAWNRLVQIKNSSNTVIATNAFDGLNRKAQVTTSSGTIDRIFSSDWQVLEEKSGSNIKNRYVWSPAYVDALVLRDRDTDSNGTLDERLYPLQDANWNTTALVNTSGSVVERDTYSPFGVVTFRDASGTSLGASAKDWLFLHQGGQTDSIGNYDFRNRVYSPTLGRWLTNDPLGFAAGDVNFYRYVGNGPGNGLDPSGLGEIYPGYIKDLRASRETSKREDPFDKLLGSCWIAVRPYNGLLPHFQVVCMNPFGVIWSKGYDGRWQTEDPKWNWWLLRNGIEIGASYSEVEEALRKRQKRDDETPFVIIFNGHGEIGWNNCMSTCWGVKIDAENIHDFNERMKERRKIPW